MFLFVKSTFELNSIFWNRGFVKSRFYYSVPTRQVFDKNSDGFLDAKELTRVVTSIGEKLSKDEVEGMIRDVDVNGDGLVDYHGKCITMVTNLFGYHGKGNNGLFGYHSKGCYRSC